MGIFFVVTFTILRWFAASSMATAYGNWSKQCWSSAKSRWYEITPWIQPSHFGCKSINKTISTRYSIRATYRTSRSTYRFNTSCYHQISTFTILSGTVRQNFNFMIHIKSMSKFVSFVGLSRCCNYIFISCWRRCRISCDGNFINKSFSWMHARDHGTDTTSSHVFVSNHTSWKCQIMWLFAKVCIIERSFSFTLSFTLLLLQR